MLLLLPPSLRDPLGSHSAQSIAIFDYFLRWDLVGFLLLVKAQLVSVKPMMLSCFMVSGAKTFSLPSLRLAKIQIRG